MNNLARMEICPGVQDNLWMPGYNYYLFDCVDFCVLLF